MIAVSDAPVISQAPTVPDTARAGHSTTATHGTWSSPTDITYSYRWQRCSRRGTACANITDATAQVYTPTEDDAASTLRIAVTARNDAGSRTAFSQTSRVVASADEPVPTTPAQALQNTAPPRVTGQPTLGSTLEVDAGTGTGTGTISYAYQWRSCSTSGTSCQAIPEATSASYSPTTDDLAHRLRVSVTASNSWATHTVVSDTTAPVHPAAPSNTIAPSISGTAIDGETLTADNGTWAGDDISYGVQWKRCEADGSACQPIPEATQTTYQAASADVGHTLRVTITATNGDGAGAETSEPTSLIAAAPPFAPSGASFFDVPGYVGVTLHVDEGEWTGTRPFDITYQWYRCDSAGCTPIDGATTPNYTLTTSDVGAQIFGLVTATNSAGQGYTGGVLEHPVEAATQPVLLGGSSPTVTGFPQTGRTLVADGGQWTGGHPITLAFQWQRCDTTGGNCLNIESATDSQYTPTAADLGHTLRSQVTATDSVGSTTATTATTDTVTASAPANAVPPEITTEDPHVGSPVTVAETGSWSGSGPISYAYQWQRCLSSSEESCDDIAGAIDTTYTATSDDARRDVRVQVTATNEHGTATVASERQHLWPAPPTNLTAPEISGSMLVNEPLTANAGTWSYTPDAFEYQWQYCSSVNTWICWDIPGATSETYSEPYEAAGTLRVVVTARNDGDPTTPTTATSARTPLITRFAQPQFIANYQEMTPNAPIVGERVSISLDLRGERPMDVQYRWRLCNGFGWGCHNIAGATNPTYTPQITDIGQYLYVNITATNSVNTASTFELSNVPIADGPPTYIAEAGLSGDAVVGGELTAAFGRWSGATAWTFQWQRCNASGQDCVSVEGHTGSSYRPGRQDLGHTFRAVITGTSSHGKANIITDPSSVVGDASRPSAATRPSIDSAPAVGEDVTASPGTWSGSPELEHDVEWQRCDATGADCSAIATGWSYRTRRTDVGHTFRVSDTATNGWGSVTVRSLPSAIVPAAPPLTNTSTPALDLLSTPREGIALTSGSQGEWAGDPDITDQWQRCDPLTSDPETEDMECVDIVEATNPRLYTPGLADIGYRLRIKETATIPGESQSVYTPATPPVGGWVNFGEGTFTGAPIVGETITAHQEFTTPGNLPADVRYEFLRLDSGTATPIQEGTEPSYTLQPEDSGHTIQIVVRVDLKRADGATVVQTEGVSIFVPPVDVAPVNDEPPTVSGDAVVGVSLTATSGNWHGGGDRTFSYRWMRCDADGETCVPITDANHVQYTLAAADIGSTIRVAVTAANGDVEAIATSAATAQVAAASGPVSQEPPTIVGSSVMRQTLTATPGSWSGSAPLVYAYQWQACVPLTDDCEDIDGETNPTYVVNDGAADSQIRVVVTASNGGGTTSAFSALTDVPTEPVPVLEKEPDLTRLGLSQPGGTLLTDGGTWQNADKTQLRYQWERCQLLGTCEEIEGADTPSYTISSADINTQLRVRVSVAGRAGAASATSTLSDPVTSAAGDAEGQIVYVNEQRTAVYVTNTDGTGNRRVIDCEALVGSDPCELFAPRISPNLQSVVVENRAGYPLGYGRILAVNIDGTGTREITTGSEPRWSPDGTEIYFTTRPENGEHTRIAVVAADATPDEDPAPLLDGLLDQQSIDISPDESQITFVARDTVNQPLRLYMASAGGEDPTRFELPAEIGNVRSASFAADGGSIVFTANSTVGDEATGDIRRIWEIDVDGSNLRAVTPPEATYGITTATSTTIVTTQQRTLLVHWSVGGDSWETFPPVTTIINTETHTQTRLPFVGYDASPAPASAARSSVPAFVRKYAPYVVPHSGDKFLPIWFGWVSRLTKGELTNDRKGQVCVHGRKPSQYPSREEGCLERYYGQPLHPGQGEGKYLEYPAGNDRDKQSSLLMHTLRLFGYRSQRQKPFSYYLVGNRNRDGSIVVQYWYFYTYNHFPVVGGDWDEHESDWEHVDIRFDASNRPVRVWFSAHSKSSVERDWGAPDLGLWRGTHPIAYAGLGSHAMSPGCVKQESDVRAPDVLPGHEYLTLYDHFTCLKRTSQFSSRPANVQGDLRKVAPYWACWKGLLGKPGAVFGESAAPLTQGQASKFSTGAAQICEAAK